MKRNVNLIELSRDHHFGLLLGWKVKQGLNHQVETQEIASYCIYFADNALLPHFEQEEQHLLGFLEEGDRMRERTLSEHEEIREAITKIRNGSNDSSTLTGLASLIESHIRFEERELFPYMENSLNPNQLEEIGRLIEHSHETYLENYPNEFWIKTN